MTFCNASTQGIEPGTVIGVRRFLYEHYGVVSGNAKVIHYASSRSDLGGDIRVRLTRLEDFLRGSSVFWSMKFPSREEARRIITERCGSADEAPYTCLKPLWDILLHRGESLFADAVLKDYAVRSSVETLKRAKSRLGERKYNLVTRNCEHFSFWCATGVSTSQQVEILLRGVRLILFRRTGVWRPLFTKDRVFRVAAELPDSRGKGVGRDHRVGALSAYPEVVTWTGSAS